MTQRKLIPLIAFTTTVLIILFFYLNIDGHETLKALPQHVGLGEHVGSSSKRPGSGNASASHPSFSDPDYAQWNPKPVYKKGSPMPRGHNYTSTLVIAKTKKENIDWMDEKMPDQTKVVYVADDPKAAHHPPKNKGHEVMIYLTWIMENYDNLPDVAIFMHAHQLAWHNEDLLGSDAHQMVTRLSRQRVWREGFVNMRCSWYPGCPDWMHQNETENDEYKPEQIFLAKSWSELFPLDKAPDILAQPCCAQFALSRERIQAKPYAQYVWYRDWLFNTKHPDWLSGRIWEYIWQFVFTGENIYCPKEHICFCDQFGICFGGEAEYADMIALENELGDRERDLSEWNDKKKLRDEAEKANNATALAILPVPEAGKNEEFEKEIGRLKLKFENLKDQARERGKDPQNRAKEAGREWHEGDDF